MFLTSFDGFLTSGDHLQIFKGDKQVFSSVKTGVLPLIDYIDSLAHLHTQVVVFDKVMGNAAALLSIRADCHEVFSPLGSQIAVKTLDKYGIEYHLIETVPFIKNHDGTDMCPMEKLSIGKDPEEFYQAVKAFIEGQRRSAV